MIILMKLKSPAQRVFGVFNILFLTLTCVICILPFWNLLAISLSSGWAVKANKVSFFPVDFSLSSYLFAFNGGRFLTALWISIQRVLLGVTVNLLLIVLTAFPLSKSKEKFCMRNIYMGFFVITMIVNGGLIPTYLVVTKLGLLNSIWSLVLPGALPVFSMIILMNFIRGLPEELEEAAVIDGATPIVLLIRVFLPLLTPALATVALFSLVGHWNEWFGGLIYMQNLKRYPLQTYLQTLLRNFERIIQLAQGDYSQIIRMMDVRSGRAAQLFLGAIPIMLVYPYLQRYFTTGLVLGSVKG
jgi:putative aldouronate transport system permease protein